MGRTLTTPSGPQRTLCSVPSCVHKDDSVRGDHVAGLRVPTAAAAAAIEDKPVPTLCVVTRREPVSTRAPGTRTCCQSWQTFPKRVGGHEEEGGERGLMQRSSSVSIRGAKENRYPYVSVPWPVTVWGEFGLADRCCGCCCCCHSRPRFWILNPRVFVLVVRSLSLSLSRKSSLHRRRRSFVEREFKVKSYILNFSAPRKVLAQMSSINSR